MNRILCVRLLPSEQSASLPLRLSFAVSGTTPTDVFRALAATIGVRVTIDPSVESAQSVESLALNGLTVDVLNFVRERHNCEWDFDSAKGLRVTKKRRGNAKTSGIARRDIRSGPETSRAASDALIVFNSEGAPSSVKGAV